MRMLKNLFYVLMMSFALMFNANAADISIFNWTANIADGVVSGVARCGPKSGSTLTSAKNWVSSNWATQNGGCFCRVQGIEDVSDWNNLNDAGSYWYGSGTGFDGGFEECSQNCAATCAQKFESDNYYQESLCGGTCPVSGSTTQYTINYDMDGGTGCENTTYTDSAIICTPTRDGYTFDGWMDNNTNEIYNGGETVSNINLDLVAFWTINNYTITYNMNGGTGCENTTYTYEDTVTLCTPTRDGYIFNGWYDNSGLTGTAVTEIASGSTGNKTYYAKWIGIEYPFTLTTTSMTANDTFKWSMSAAGTFYVDCGDGGVLSGTGVSGNTITRSNTTTAQYTCTYPNAGTHTIRFGGTATGYNNATMGSSSYAAIGFSTANYSNNTPTKIAGISGSLGAIFGTIGTGDTLATQPRFIDTFLGCSKLTGSIPENLFARISGAPATNMFTRTFSRCSKLSGAIPENLFVGISGAPASEMFSGTFSSCGGLTGSIPENLFAGISGAPATDMFNDTFNGCSGLTGSIPANLFAGISGAPAGGMFQTIFVGCNGLTGSIPEDLFAGIKGAPANNMFSGTFVRCSGLTGSIPENLFAGISGAPAQHMFSSTFNACSGLSGSIPENLFAGISGAPANSMFAYTFYNCSKLTGFTDGTTTISYVPGTFLAGIDTNTSVSSQASSMFAGTGLSNPCPANTYAVTRPQFSDAGKPWCAPCPDGTTSPAGSTSVDQCVVPSYTITYNLNGGTGCENTTYASSDTVTLCTPTRDGYEFDGWYDNAEFNGDAVTEIASGSTGNKTLYAKWVSSNAYTCPNGYISDSVPSQASDCYYNVNAGQYISYSPLNVDASVNGFGQNGNMGYKTIQYENDPLNTITEENTWYFNFSYGALYGDSACRPDNDPYGTWNTVSDTDFPKGNQNNGSVCWCRLNSDNDPGLTGVGYKSKWVARGYVDSGDCWKDCAYDCSQIVGQVYGWSDDIRPSMLNNITLTTSSCPAGYYCPGGRVLFGETGKIACPANSNSSNGAATCTCDSGWATLDGNGATNENPCYKTCSLGQYANNGTCVSCPTGYTTTTTHATSISDCVISSQPGTHLVPDADATITGGYTYFKDGEGYSSQSEFASAQSNSWKDFFSYGNLGGRAACSDIWAEYGTVSDVDFDPITWYGKNCWCDIEQYGDCTVDNRTDCSNDNTTTTKSKWVSFGYVENDRCWQDCAGKCANAMEQNATMRTNALSTIVAQSVTCPAGYYCPNTVTVSYGNVTTSKIACPDGTTSPAGATSIDQCVTPSYTITYNLNGGTGCSNTTYTSSDTVTLCTPTRDGYIFNGWYDNAELTGDAVTEIASGSTGNREYWAKWTALPYTITYNLNDGTNYADAPTSYTVETPTITLGTPTRSGYIFDGWYDNAEFNGDAVTEIASGSTGNREYWAKWTATSYTITLNTDSGTFPTGVVAPTEYTISDLPVALPTPTRDGYTFNGWYENAEFNGDAVSEIASGSIGSKTYYAKWTRNEFVCESGIWLHIGDEDKVCMYENKPDAPTMVVETQNGRYYMMLNENADAPIHDGSNKKMRVEIGNRIYNVHDGSVNMK